MTQHTQAHIFVDGATASNEYSGIAAIARSADGHFLGWGSRRLAAMTNNEAEYEALLLGMELGRRLGLRELTIVSDSEVVIWQMRGRSRVVSPRLRGLHRRACAEARHFRRVEFCHVLREHNELADALATEALRGRTIALPSRGGLFRQLTAWLAPATARLTIVEEKEDGNALRDQL